MIWHVDTTTLESYLEGSLDRSAAASVETHVTGCAACRAQVPAEPDRDHTTWTTVLTRVAAPPPTVSERAMRRIGAPVHTARLVAIPLSAGRSWLLATAVVLALAVLTARAAIGPVPQLWLLLTAPLVPVAGVAAIYRSPLSRCRELESAAPFDGFRLLLLRSVTVTATALAMSTIADLAVPSRGLGAAWLLPSLALVLATLAIGVRWSLPLAALTVGTTWLAIVVLATSAGNALLVFGAVGQTVHLALLLLATVVLVRRSGTYDLGDLR